jgi:hydrogenase maturation factor
LVGPRVAGDLLLVHAGTAITTIEDPAMGATAP